MVKTPQTVYVVLIPLAILLNVILIVIGVYSYIGGFLEIAIALWVLTAILDVFMIIGIIKVIKFHEKVQPLITAAADPTCLIFLPFIIGAILIVSSISIIIL